MADHRELSAAGRQRIVVPTRYRGDYLHGLRMTHNAISTGLLAVLAGLQSTHRADRLLVAPRSASVVVLVSGKPSVHGL